MNQINLLPWREERRQLDKVRFGIMTLIFITLALLCVGIIHIYYRNVIYQQNQQKAYIESILNVEQVNLGRLNARERELKLVVSNLNFIFGLKIKSYQAVDALDQLVKVVPEGIYFSELSRDDNKLTLTGMAKSNIQVTSLMEQIEKSKIFKQPVLTEITGKETNVSGVRNFILKVELEKYE